MKKSQLRASHYKPTNASFYRGGPERLRTTNMNSIVTSHLTGAMNQGANPNKSKPFDPKDYTNVGLDEREVMIYKEIFDLFDVSNNQMLAPKELLQGLKLSGLNVDMQTTYNVISSCNLKDISKINFREFLKLATDARPCDKDQESEYYSIFLAIRSMNESDTMKGKKEEMEDRNYLVREDIEKLFRSNNESISKEEIERLMTDVFEIEKTDGKIYFDKFYKVMKDVVAPKNLKLF